MNASLINPARPGVAWLAGGLAVGLLAAVMMGAGMGTARAQDDSEPPTRMISVSGIGRVFVAPDVADISVGVVSQDKEAGVASAKTAEGIDAVIKALLELGIEEKDIKTTQLSLNPIYDWDVNPPRIDGWEATNMVSVTVRDVTQVGAIVDAAVAAGANRIDGVTFRVDDSTAATAEARTAAMANAKATAEQLAKEAGVTITGVISITESSAPAPTPIYMERAMAAGEAMDASVATKVMAGEVEVQVTVFVVYSIE